MNNIVFVPGQNLINAICLIVHIGRDFFNIRHAASPRPSIAGYFFDAMQIVIVVMEAFKLANTMLFLSTLSLRRATAKVHKTVGHFCAYETNFMGIASSC